MQWAEQIRCGNRRAFTELFETYYVPLCQYAYRFIQDEEVREDVVQDLFAWIWERRDDWKPGVSVRAYLYRAIHNRIITCIRKKRFECPLDESGQNTIEVRQLSPFDELQIRELGLAITNIINLLPERRKQILLLRLQHELSYKEISVILNISVNTVDTQIRRALKLLRHRLKPFRTHGYALKAG